MCASFLIKSILFFLRKSKILLSFVEDSDLVRLPYNLGFYHILLDVHNPLKSPFNILTHT